MAPPPIAMIYLTYADPPSGVYSSQVCDVIKYVNETCGARMRLVAFVSMRGFRAARRKICAEVPGALVLPIVPRINRWGPSILLFAAVSRWLGSRRVVARGVLACHVALKARGGRRDIVICYDGRGAIAAEWHEYDVGPYQNVKRAIRGLESNAVLETGFRIAVSRKLIEYWSKEYGYRSDRHVVIPCTLNRGFGFALPPAEAVARTRAAFGYAPGDVVLIYSGSVSGWQSFALVRQFVTPVLRAHTHVRLLFLSGSDPAIDALAAEFPGQVANRWVPHKEVQGVLAAGDYGVLIREKKTTNYVAAPTKFAEYLSAGLPVLISEDIGDYTGFVNAHGCGTVIGETTSFEPIPPTRERRLHCLALAQRYFSKESQRERYKEMLAAMGEESWQQQ